MNNLERIRAEIERRKKILEKLIDNDNPKGFKDINSHRLLDCQTLLDFITSLPNWEGEDLEQEIDRYYKEMDGDCRYVQTARHFARWQLQSIWHDARYKVPLDYKAIIVINKEGAFAIKYYCECSTAMWDEVKSWAYVVDTLPRKEDEK